MLFATESSVSVCQSVSALFSSVYYTVCSTVTVSLSLGACIVQQCTLYTISLLVGGSCGLETRAAMRIVNLTVRHIVLFLHCVKYIRITENKFVINKFVLSNPILFSAPIPSIYSCVSIYPR